MITLAVNGCNGKNEDGDYDVAVYVSFDDIRERAVFELALDGTISYFTFSDGSFSFPCIKFTSMCCIVSAICYLCKVDSCITVDDLDLFNVDEEIKEDLLHIAELYYKIPGGSVYA